MKYFLLIILNVFGVLFFSAQAQQVNGVFTPFAKNNDWVNTGINSVNIESDNSITLNGYYEGNPNKYPMVVRLNSNGTIKTTYGAAIGGGVLFMNNINISAVGTVLDRSYEFWGGATLLAGHHHQTGQGYLTKAFVSGGRPSEFNVVTYPVPTFTKKTYIEDWAVTDNITYTARMEAVTATNHKVVVTAYDNTTGEPVASFGTNGSTTLFVEGWLPLEDALPLKLSRHSDGTLYVAFTQTATAESNYIMLYKLNSNGILDSAYGHNVGIGYASFAVPRPYALTSLILNTNGTITMGGYHATGNGNEKVSFRNYNNATNTISSTSFNVPVNQIGVGTGCKTTAAVLDYNGGNERTVFAVAFPFAPNRYRIFIHAYNPGAPSTTLNITPWQYPGALSAEPTDIVRLGDGSFIVVGIVTRQNGITAGCVIKYNADGTIDNSFGEQGSYILNGRHGGTPWADVTQLPNHKYLAVGSVTFLPTALTKKALIVNRFNSDGSIDTSFGTNGTLYAYTSDYSRLAAQVHPLANGKFLIGGTYENYQNEPGIGTGTSGAKATIFRFNADGSPDNSFGMANNGRLHFSGYVGLSFVEMQVIDDSIYMAGNTFFSTGLGNTYIYKLSPNGSIAGSYVPSLRQVQTFTINNVTGDAYVGGRSFNSKLICKVKRGSTREGRPDSSFGTNGTAIIPLVSTGEIASIKQIKVHPGGILVASEYASNNNSNATKGLYFTLISQNGIVDAGFGTNGNKFLSLPDAYSIIPEKYRWTGQDNNRLLIFGQAIVNGLTKGFIAKVDLNGDLDATFGTGGVIWTTATFEDHIVFDNDGDIIAIQNLGFLKGGALAKLQIPADLYNRIKQGSWTGTVNNDWFNTGNWAEGSVPDALTEVVIANGSVLIGINQQAFAYSVRVLGGASFTIGANSTLEITKKNL